MKSDEKKQIHSWKSIQDEIADEKNTAIVLLDKNSSELNISNNNSMCLFLYSSAEFAPRCAEFCGQAFQTAHKFGAAIHVKCHADLDFLTVPIQIGDKKAAAIVGRTFLKIEDYRKATERAVNGDWQEFSPEEFFSNVLISRSPLDLEKTAKRLENLRDEEKSALLKFIENADQSKLADKIIKDSKKFTAPIPLKGNPTQVIRKNAPEIEEFAEWRKIFSSLLNLSYAQACGSTLNFLARRYALSNLAWLEPCEDVWEKIAAVGNLENQQMEIRIAADDERLRQILRAETFLELRERASGKSEELQTLRMFPVAVGGKVHGAVIVGDKVAEENTASRIVKFLRNIASELEILRLRKDLKRQTMLSKMVRKFNDSLKNIDAEDYWSFMIRASAELLQAERGSLLIFDEGAQKFSVKAAIGNRADIINAENETLGERVARGILDDGNPVAVGNIDETGFLSAPPEWSYKTKSFISYPITIGDRKVGIFNVADKIGGRLYDESDLELLAAVAPQIAVALDRAIMKNRAGRFEQLSITDSLTGLLNRRYLEERLTEEISRSQRYNYPISFMMIDVDEFKSYNDNFTHPEGDKALKIVGRLMKETLRSADVAARYGGEEFSILLPQTNLTEAHTIAERIREKIEHEKFPNRRVTVSIGIAEVAPELTTPSDLISAADKALYKAKRMGRNNVQIYSRK